WSSMHWWCFLFQGEDGIRDWSVTGVQTCALPISIACRSLEARGLMLGEGERRPHQRGRITRGVGAAGDRDGGEVRRRRAISVHEIGRAACRERVEVWGGGGSMRRESERRGIG